MRNRKIEDFACFDIETVTEKYDLLCLSLYSDCYQEIFMTYSDFFKFIVNKKINKLFAFYGGGFDFLLLLDYLKENKKFKLIDIIEISGLIIYLKIDFSGFQFELIDAFGIFRGYSLNEVALNLLGEQKIDLDRTRLQDYDLKLVKEYCLKDSELLYRSLIEFKNEIGFLDITISRIALLSFMNNFCTHKKDLIRYNSDQIDVFNNWYFGGHVDVFKRYGEDLKYYDINSCYGYSMLEFGAPFKYISVVDKFSDTSTQKGLYNCLIETDLNIPLIPKKVKFDNYEKTFFLNSREPFQVTSLDIELFEKLNVKYKVLNGYLFEYDKDFFKYFVQYWYKQRTINPKLKFISKLIINSLYGKFGQKIRRLSTVISDKLKPEQYIDSDLKIGRREIMQINYFSKPEIASFVTSGARHIHSLLLSQYQDSLYYGDTDSIIVDRNIDIDLIGSDIGKVKLEYKNVERGYFVGSKFYGLFNSREPLYFDKNKQPVFKSVILKGYELKQDLNEAHFNDILENDKFNFSYEKKSLLKFKRSLQLSNKFISNATVKKDIKVSQIKRKLINKVDTEPFFLINNQLT